MKLVCSNIAEQSIELYDNKGGHPLHNCRVNFRNMPRLKITFKVGTWWSGLGKSLYMLRQNYKINPRKSSGLLSKYKVREKSGGW